MQKDPTIGLYSFASNNHLIFIMAPRKRKKSSGREIQADPIQTKRVTLTDREKLICKKKLDALDKEESLANEDRFTMHERRLLLQAYSENGFHVFHDTKLLHKYLPNRRESDLMVLVQRLRSSLQVNLTTNDGTSIEEQSQPLEEWQKLCNQLMGSFAKDKKVNLDDILSEALLAAAEQIEFETSSKPSATVEVEKSSSNDLRPSYPKLVKSFAQMLMGLFPERMDAATAQLSMRLFLHINSVVDSFDLEAALSQLHDGTWLEGNAEERRLRQENALAGLIELDRSTKKCPTIRDIESSRNVEALCLELPKIKRITDVLNPLHINESLVSTLME